MRRLRASKWRRSSSQRVTESSAGTNFFHFDSAICLRSEAAAHELRTGEAMRSRPITTPQNPAHSENENLGHYASYLPAERGHVSPASVRFRTVRMQSEHS